MISAAPDHTPPNRFRTIGLPLLTLAAGGLLVMGLTWLLYALLYNLLEALFYPTDPQAFPAGNVRLAYAVLMVLLIRVLLRTRLSDLLKALLITGPLSTVMITVSFMFYERPVLSIASLLVVAGAFTLWLYRAKKAWLYYFAGLVAALVSLAYAWPAP